MAPVFAGCLEDARVNIHVGDVTALIAAAPKAVRYDAILLDVDNGPDALTRDSNDGLYSLRGLAQSRNAIKSGGVLAVWSSGPDPRFTHRMEQSGFKVEEVRVRAHGKTSGPKHTIWIGKRV
jgi:spermidine synthase